MNQHLPQSSTSLASPSVRALLDETTCGYLLYGQHIAVIPCSSIVRDWGGSYGFIKHASQALLGMPFSRRILQLINLLCQFTRFHSLIEIAWSLGLAAEALLPRGYRLPVLKHSQAHQNRVL